MEQFVIVNVHFIFKPGINATNKGNANTLVL
jgi:hypothetical protein